MSTAAAGADHRKRKLDPAPHGENKRRRPYTTPSKTMGEHRPSALAQHVKPVNAGSNDASPKTNDSGSGPEYSNTVDQGGYSDSEDDLSHSELSLDTETSSDSGISSSDYEEDDEDEDDLEPDSRSDDANSGRVSHGDESDMISLPKQVKPSITSYSAASGSAKLQSRIAAFLPQLRKANEDLVTAGDNCRIDAVPDDEDHYIEMDLGLGVLKEKRTRAPSNMIRTRQSSSSNSTSSSSSSKDDSTTESTGADAMSKLMGRMEKRRNGGPVIQEFSEP